ncbi:hypothetical protein BD408DRAFT_435472 [Parasitella parasitica]|nr:hypothetical protein BD408DRAFT_435472 [Parasitella parasitica]
MDIILCMDWMVHEDWALRPKTKELFKVKEAQNTQTMKTKEEQLAEDILKDYSTLIPNDDEPQTITNAPYKHRVIIGDALPVLVRDYRRPFAETQQIKKKVAEMLRKGVCNRTKHKRMMFACDYCKLNAITVKDKFPIGNLNELLDQLHGFK